MGDVRWGVLWILRRYVCALRGCKRDYPILNRVAEEPFSKELNEMQGLGNSPKVRKFWKFLQKVARIWFPTQCLRPMMPSGRKRSIILWNFVVKKGFSNFPICRKSDSSKSCVTLGVLLVGAHTHTYPYGRRRRRIDNLCKRCIILILSVFSVSRGATLRFCFRSSADLMSVCSWYAVNTEGG